MTDSKSVLLDNINWKDVTEKVKHDYATARRQHLSKLKVAYLHQYNLEREFKSNPFLGQLLKLSHTMRMYEDEEAQGDAIDIIVSSDVYARIEAKSNELGSEETELDYPDLLVKELLKWFKEDFFKWVNKPECPSCHNDDQNKIQGLRPSPPNLPIHFQGRASIIENYKCTACGSVYQFPRYNNPRQLLKSRSGRCGEWANCFVLILKSLQIPVRYLWNLEDHVWCEYYSKKLKRWIHLDCCENAYDNPLLYNHGWGKKMSYVFAISDHYIVDVSDKYIDKSKGNALPRNKVDEKVLKAALFYISAGKIYSIKDDEKFLDVFSDYFYDFKKIHGLKEASSSPSTTKTGEMVPRQSGAGEWTRTRGEDGS